MRGNTSSILAVSGGYAAAVIGAGFASGQEIVSFFVKFGKYGIIGIAVSCAAFALFAYAVTGFCTKRKIYSYSDFLAVIIRRKPLVYIAEAAVFLCAAASMCVMTACAGEIGAMSAGFSQIVGAALFITLCGAALFMETRGTMGINSAIGIIITAGIIFTCFYIFRFREHQTFSMSVSAVVSGVSYAGYNLIGTGAVLACMSRLLGSKRDAAMASVAAGVSLFIMITLIYGVLSVYYGKIDLGEIPMLTMALRQNRPLGVFYGIMLAMAVLSTGIANGFALVDILSRAMRRKTAVLTVTLSALAMSGAGFSTLVNTAYRFCGYVGAVVSAVIIIAALKVKNKE